MNKIHLSRPYIGQEEIDAVTEVLKSGRLSLGPKLSEFEKKFAEYIGTKYAVAVSSGTSALHLCMLALGLKDKNEVITTPFSFIASANCILFEGAKPVFVDIEEDTLNINTEKIESAITPKTKAILPVHVFGQPCNMDAIMQIAEKHNLIVLEDACEAVGAAYKGKNIGTFGKVSVFSFYPNKQMTTGEGGMIVTDDKEIYEMCKSLRNQGRSDDMQWLNHHKLGYNYRLDEMSCALGVEQLKKIDEILEKRAEVANEYARQLKDIEGVTAPQISENVKMSWFVYVVKLAEDVDRDAVMKKMNERGIECKAYFPEIHLQPFYKEKFQFKEGDFPVCEKISKKTLALPFYTDLSKKDIERVCETLKECI